jgi:uncharacterized small protein (DUF1192 family)
MSQYGKKVVVILFALPLLLLGSARPLTAEIIGTLPALEATQRDRDLETVNRALAGEQVERQLAKLGVSPDDVDARVAALTDEELRTLAQRMDSTPAGGIGVLGVIGIAFVVILVLELVGAIDIFKKMP